MPSVTDPTQVKAMRLPDTGSAVRELGADGVEASVRNQTSESKGLAVPAALKLRTR